MNNKNKEYLIFSKNVYDFLLKGNTYIFTKSNLENIFGKSENYIKKYISFGMKKGELYKIRSGYYTFNNLLHFIDSNIIANMLDKKSYISGYSILERKNIKQGYNHIYSITQNSNKKDYIVNGINYKYYFSKISQNFGIYINKKGIREANIERTLLDIIYIHIYGKESLRGELYLDFIDKEKIKEYLGFYPKMVEKFYNNNFKDYVV